MAINLAGRVPVITKAFSNRLVWVGVVLLLLFIAAVVFGFRYRFKKQQARKESQQIQSTASDASTSNRAQVEGGHSLSPPTLSGLPVASNPATSNVPYNPNAAAWQPTTQSYSPAAYQPMYYPGQPSEAETVHEPTLNREERRRQQALEAPTGATEPRQSALSPDSTQGDLSQLNSLLRQPAGPAAAPPIAPGGSPAGDTDQNDQTGKRIFAGGGEGVGDDYLKAMRTAPLGPWVVQRGTVIPASLPNQLVSDLPGDLMAEVVRDVYDSPTQKYVEIPAGSRLVGEYNSSVSYGQNRVQIVWTAIYFPDGSFIDLDRFPSHSAEGATGLKDQTDNHWKRTIAGVALSSILSAGLQVSQNRTNGGNVLSYPTTGQVIASSVGSQVSQLGQQLAQRNLNVQPTLKIRPGEIFAVSVKKDILFRGPYEAMRPK